TTLFLFRSPQRYTLTRSHRTQPMKDEELNAAQIWIQFEDLLLSRLHFSPADRAVYSHLLRHSRLAGLRRLRFSIAWLAQGARLSVVPARQAVRRLIANGVLRLVKRSKAGHVVDVRLPREVRPARPDGIAARHPARPPRALPFQARSTKGKALRQAIHARERGRCFYCLRRLTPRLRTLDHVVPQV